MFFIAIPNATRQSIGKFTKQATFCDIKLPEAAKLLAVVRDMSTASFGSWDRMLTTAFAAAADSCGVRFD